MRPDKNAVSTWFSFTKENLRLTNVPAILHKIFVYVKDFSWETVHKFGLYLIDTKKSESTLAETMARNGLLIVTV
jgi:hypothetical protein